MAYGATGTRRATGLTAPVLHRSESLLTRLVKATLCAWLFVTLDAAALSASVAASGAYVWRNVKVGGGGFIPNIVFSRVEPGLAYARSDMGGVYRWDARRETWAPLQDAATVSSYFGVESVAPDPVDPDKVYVAAGMWRGGEAAILRSGDRGASWETFPVSFRMGGNEDGRGLGERLAVDPNDTALLYFGSRHDGLQRSRDHGASWSRVESFPFRGAGTPPQGAPTNAGISFVLFDPSSGAPGEGSRTIIAAVAEPGPNRLYRSDDAGGAWRAVAGEPRADLVPVQGELDSDGSLYIAYSKGVGPNGVSDGAVYRYDMHTGEWIEITPPREPDDEGGYMGLSVDRQRPGVVVVATMNRWNRGDTIWRSVDGGMSWRDLRPASRRDVSATPFLLWGEEEADFGWWMAGLAIDPFDSDHLVYTTGATVYATRDSAAGAMTWRPWVEGIEQTAIITLASPPEGSFSLLSGFGDISGFAHETLDMSPVLQFKTPVFSNTNTIDYAGMAPAIVVRSGVRPHRIDIGAPTLAWSDDYGRSWTPLVAPPLRWSDPDGALHETRFDLTGDRAITVSADGDVFVFMAPVPIVTHDRGRTWAPSRGLPLDARPVADRVEGRIFYAMDFERGEVLVSRDGAQTFTAQRTRGLPPGLAPDRPVWREHAWPLHAAPGHAGHLWYVSKQGLYRSADGGARFTKVESDIGVEMLAFGAPPPRRSYPALYAIGWRGQTRGVFRSDDQGRSWTRVNDEHSEYARRFRCIAADPRVYGRVYIGTDGRGVVYGEPAARPR